MNDVTHPMLGQWESEGNNVLVIEKQKEHAVIYYNENDTWLIHVLDAKIVGNTVTYTTEHYLRDGTSHPFNGVPCHTIMEMLDDNRMKQSLTSEHQLNYESGVLERAN